MSSATAETAVPSASAASSSAAAGQPQQMQFPVGYGVKLVTQLGDTLEGEVFTYDRASNVVVLAGPDAGAGAADGRAPLERGARQYRMLRANYIREVVSVEKPKAGAHAGVLGAIDMQWVDQREAENIR